jgi:hypothetical protein
MVDLINRKKNSGKDRTMSDDRFSARDWVNLGFNNNEEAFQYLDRDADGFYAILTDSFNSGKKVPLPWKRYLRGEQSEKSAKIAIRNSLKSNSGRKGMSQVDFSEFISPEDKKKIEDTKKKLAKIQEAALKAARERKEKEDTQRQILELAERAGLKVKLE